MPVPLPNLDDRRWADLVEEGRSLIPLYARETWTDHNAHDPGITLMELFAWIAEMDLYQINRIPDRHRRKFLALVGIAPEPPRPARTVLSFAFKDGADLLELPAEIEFEGKDALGQAVRFRTLDLINVIPGRLMAIQLKDTTGFHDLTERWQRGEVISLFGTMPKPGAELYLGFSHPLPKDRWVNLFWSFAHPRSGEDERRRLIEEAKARHDACRPPLADYGCKPNTEPAQPVPDKTDRVASHHGVRLVFEALIARGAGTAWQRLDAEENEVEDDTRVLTLDGTIRIRLLQDMARPDNDPRLSRDLYYLRVRFAAGAYDTPPLLRTVVLNGVRAEQAVPADIMLPTGDSHSKPVRVVYGTGAPHQRLRLAEAPVIESSLELFTVEDNARRVWELRRDFDASKRDSAHFLLDPKDGTVLFGDGENGRVPPLEAQIFVAYHAMLGEAGNLAAHAVYRLADSPYNRAVVKDFDDLSKRFSVSFKVTGKALASLRVEGVPDAVLKQLEGIKDREIQIETDFLRILEAILGEEPTTRHKFTILKHARSQCEAGPPDCITVTNPVPATGGAPGETLAEAIGRAIEAMRAPQRAVTLRDYEEMALNTPGTRLARAEARANLHPSFPCLKAPGTIMLIILPDMPGPRPMPSPGLRRAVAAYLNRRRIIGTRVEVVGPTYLEVAVYATIKACAGVNKTALRQRIVDALNEFFDPLKGGPKGTGWPFGRDVYRSEILQVIDEVAGVDHVLALGLFAQDCEPQCGNVCLAPTWLVAAGQHQIQVE